MEASVLFDAADDDGSRKDEVDLRDIDLLIPIVPLFCQVDSFYSQPRAFM